MSGALFAQRSGCTAPSGLVGNGRRGLSTTQFVGNQKLWPLSVASRRTTRRSGPLPVNSSRRSSSKLLSASYAPQGLSTEGEELPPVDVNNRKLPSRTTGSPHAWVSDASPQSAHKPRESATGPLWTPGAWLAAVLQRAGPVLAAVCLGLAWALAKPAPASAHSQLTRPFTVSSVRQLSDSVKRKAGGLAGGTLHQNGNLSSDSSDALVGAHSTSSTSLTSKSSDNDVSKLVSPVRELASRSQAVQLSSPSSSPAPFDHNRTQSAPSDSSPPSTSETLNLSSSDHRASFHNSHFQRGAASNPLLDFLEKAGPGPSGLGDPSGRSDGSGDPSGRSDGSNGKKPKGVQAREKLDVYYLPDQIPKPKDGEWISDQGPFIEPDWITTRVNEIVNNLKKDTGTELVVVAVNALGKHAGVPEMVATELCQQWQVGGPKGDGLLFLYVNKGGSSWEKMEGGEIEMDVPYKRQLAVKILPGLEQKLDKWGARNARGGDPPTAQDIVGEVREVVRAKMATGKCTFGEVILEGIAGMGEKVWTAENKRAPSKMRVDPTAAKRRENVEWITVALTVFLVWSWADKGNRLSLALQQVYPWFAGVWVRGTKQPGPVCDACGEPTTLRGKAKLEEIKDGGSRKEAEIGSMGYYAYVCENLDCKAAPESRLNLVKWIQPFRAKRCPGCRYWTVKQTSQPVQRAGLFRDGVVKRSVKCQQCGVRGERVMRDPSFFRALRVWEPQMVDVEIGRSESAGILDGDGPTGAIQPARS